MNPCETRNSFRRAFRFWESIAEITFEEAKGEEKADIEINFGFCKFFINFVD